MPSHFLAWPFLSDTTHASLPGTKHLPSARESFLDDLSVVYLSCPYTLTTGNYFVGLLFAFSPLDSQLCEDRAVGVAHGFVLRVWNRAESLTE